MIQERGVSEIANALDAARKDTNGSRSEVVFWIGAGASVTAGIPSAEGVVDHFLERRWLKIQPRSDSDVFTPVSWNMPDDKARDRKKEVRAWALLPGRVAAIDRWRADNPGAELKPEDTDWWKLYSVCMDSFGGPADRQAFVTDVVQRRNGVNVAHLRLAYMMHKNFITTVVTTNFDDLLRRALSRYDEFPSELDGNSIDELAVSASFLQVAYLHGRLTSYRQRHTGAEVKRKIPYLESYLRQALRTGCLVVVGYRGGNETPMDILHKVICGRRPCCPGRGLYWISKESEAECLPQRVREILDRPYTYWVRGSKADEFLHDLCLLTVGTPPSTSIPSDELLVSALEECKRADNCIQRGDQDQAITHCRHALMLDPTLVKAYVLWAQALGFSARKSGNSEQRRTLLDDAVEKCKRASSLDPMAAEPLFCRGKRLLDQYELLGDLKSPEAALEKFQRAVDLDPANRFIYSNSAKALEILGKCAEAKAMRAAADSMGSPQRR